MLAFSRNGGRHWGSGVEIGDRRWSSVRAKEIDGVQ